MRAQMPQISHLHKILNECLLLDEWAIEEPGEMGTELWNKNVFHISTPNYFYCDMCSSLFSTSSTLDWQQHREKHHASGTVSSAWPTTCPTCISDAACQEHLSQVHCLSVLVLTPSGWPLQLIAYSADILSRQLISVKYGKDLLDGLEPSRNESHATCGSLVKDVWVEWLLIWRRFISLVSLSCMIYRWFWKLPM